MYPKLQADQDNQAAILDTAVTAAAQFLQELPHRPAAVTPKPHDVTDLPADGRVFLTPTQYKDTPAIRASISNWQTTRDDLKICWQTL